MTPIIQARELVEQCWQSNDLRGLDFARNLLEEALVTKPEDLSLLICLGAVLSDKGEHLLAVSVLERAVELGSVDRNAYTNLAIALMNCSDGRHRAMRFFKKAGELAPSPETWEAYFDPQAH